MRRDDDSPRTNTPLTGPVRGAGASVPWLFGPCLFGLWLYPFQSSAYEYTHCLGEARHWAADPTLEVDACTVGAGGPVEEDRLAVVRQAVNAWNSIGGTDLRITLAERGTCGARVGDGVSTVAFVPPAAIDGAFGLTLRRYGGVCAPLILRNTGIVEADVLINDESPRDRLADDPMVCDDAQPRVTAWQAIPAAGPAGRAR